MKNKDKVNKIREEIKARKIKEMERQHRQTNIRINKLGIKLRDYPTKFSLSETVEMVLKINDINIERDILHAQIETLDKMNLIQLPNNLHLSNHQLNKLYYKMIEHGYISNTTNEDIFVWYLGGSEKPSCLIDWDLAERSSYIEYDNINIHHLQLYFEKKLSDNRITWTKYTSTTHKYYFNKQALLDFMELLKVPEELWSQSNYCSKFFINERNEEIIFNRQNYKDFQISNHKSEYHNDLQEIISSIL